MVNLNIPYRRSCLSLAQMQDEIQMTWPHREQNKGFVTGYKSAGNYSGHNASNLGITFAYDIGVDIEGDGTGLLPKDAEWLANYLRKKKNPRFMYLIYNRRIAGNHTNWKWVRYTGASPHTDHIHISVLDLYWGNAVSVPPSVYDSTKSWGIYKAYRKIDIIPVSDKDTEMAATLKKILNKVNTAVRRSGDVVDVPRNYGSKEYRKKNPTWLPQNVFSRIWNDGIESRRNSAQAEKNSAQTLAIVEEMAKSPDRNLSEDDINRIKGSVAEVWEDALVDVNVEVSPYAEKE